MLHDTLLQKNKKKLHTKKNSKNKKSTTEKKCQDVTTYHSPSSYDPIQRIKFKISIMGGLKEQTTSQECSGWPCGVGGETGVGKLWADVVARGIYHFSIMVEEAPRPFKAQRKQNHEELEQRGLRGNLA